MRKVLLTVVVITLILVPVSAKNSFAVGVNLGTNMGAGVQYQMKDFDLVGNVGYGLLHGVLSVDAAASYTVTNFTINKVRIDVTGGVGGYLGVPFRGCGQKVGLSMMLDQDSCDTQEGSFPPKTS